MLFALLSQVRSSLQTLFFMVELSSSWSGWHDWASLTSQPYSFAAAGFTASMSSHTVLTPYPWSADQDQFSSFRSGRFAYPWFSFWISFRYLLMLFDLQFWPKVFSLNLKLKFPSLHFSSLGHSTSKPFQRFGYSGLGFVKISQQL